ncbi:hypothetical protein BDV96DRAFT_114419 [Lophiotrema nucula]|uniref:Zn(2)-C6 fungal-type domain-containing protein n=1 Tax=Lophiotrema nucula TaxID=690887 RepID=A0A6A5Z5I6_9PLEO|nr:hypothetical protein BDV96DRAFT_114419 [Lophiotrema nucula]
MRATSNAGSRGKNISKACEACRRRKQKCDGEDPCSICRRRSLTCSYRDVTRSRGLRGKAPERANSGSDNGQSTQTVDDRNVSSRLSEADMEHLKTALPRDHIINTLRATRSAKDTPSSVSQLSYGPSSNFSILRHFKAHLEPGDELPVNSPGSLELRQDGTQSIDLFKFQERAFGNDLLLQDDATFLSSDLATTFLDTYLRTTYYQFPMVSTDTLRSYLARLYEANPTNVLASSEKAFLLAVLTAGAITKDHDWRMALFAKAMKEVDKIRYEISLPAIQTEILLAHCEFIGGSLQRGYQILGGAVRKAIAAGLHKSSPAWVRRQGDSSEATALFWLVYCYETFMCFTFGWPPSIHREDIDAPLPEYATFTRALFDMSEIIQQVHRMYMNREVTIKHDLKAAYHILKKLQSWARTVNRDFEISISKSIQHTEGEKLIHQITLSYHYFYTVCLTFRPFLLLSLEIGRENAERSEFSQSILVKINATLPDACERCIDAARCMIGLCQSVYTLYSEAEGVSYHELFLETACFVLIAATLRDKTSYSSNASFIRTGITCLRKTSRSKRREELITAVEQLLAGTEKLATNAPSPKASPTSHALTQSETSSQIQPLPAHISTLQYDQGFIRPSSLPNDVEAQPGDGIWELGQAEQTLQILDQMPDTAWPYMDWNLNMSNLDVDLFNSYIANPIGGDDV